jgi:hypothetical protein
MKPCNPRIRMTLRQKLPRDHRGDCRDVSDPALSPRRFGRYVRAASAAGLSVMVGRLLGSSLAMAPGAVLAAAAGADSVDLDGPLWLARDEGPWTRAGR